MMNMEETPESRQQEVSSKNPDPLHHLLKSQGAAPDLSWQISATDLLVPWNPGPAGSLASQNAPDWDRYFEGTSLAQPDGLAPIHPVSVRGAQEVTDCLYDFLRELEARRFQQAMDYVSEDFHAMIDGTEHDRAGLLRWLTKVFDPWCRLPAISVTLGEIPEPVPHPYGFLIKTVLTVDPVENHQERQSLLIKVVFVFYPVKEHTWRIGGLHLLEDHQEPV